MIPIKSQRFDLTSRLLGIIDLIEISLIRANSVKQFAQTIGDEHIVRFASNLEQQLIQTMAVAKGIETINQDILNQKTPETVFGEDLHD